MTTEKLLAMEVFKDTPLVKLELLSNATTIEYYTISEISNNRKKSSIES